MLPPPVGQGSLPTNSFEPTSFATPTSSDSIYAKSLNTVDAKVIGITTGSYSNSQFYIVGRGHVPPPSPADMSRLEAAQNFLSSIPSRTRSFFDRAKQGLIEFGASVRQFSSLMPNKAKTEEAGVVLLSTYGADKAKTSTYGADKAEKEQFLTDIKNLSAKDKQKRMDVFVDFFDDQAVAREGIFRLAPNYNDVKVMQKPFLDSSFKGFKTESQEVNAENKDPTNEIASLFKDFLGAVDLFEQSDKEKGKDASDSAMSPRELFIQAATIKDGGSEGQIKMLQAAIKQMKPENVELLKGLLGICDKTLEHVETNKMHATNLATVFGPRLAPKNSFDLTYNIIAALLITHREALFPSGS